MKKILLLATASFLLAMSCSKENAGTENDPVPVGTLELSAAEMRSLDALSGRTLSRDEAVSLAETYFAASGVSTKNSGATEVTEIRSGELASKSSGSLPETLAYVVGFENGFVVVNTVPGAPEIAFWSPEGKFDAENDFSRLLLERVKAANAAAAEENLEMTALAEQALQKLSERSGYGPEEIRMGLGGKPVTKLEWEGHELFTEIVYGAWRQIRLQEPLLTTRMHQLAPYNSGHRDAYGTNDTRISPDVIAVAQIAAFNEFPSNAYYNGAVRPMDWPQIKADYGNASSNAYVASLEQFTGAIMHAFGIHLGPAPWQHFIAQNDFVNGFRALSYRGPAQMKVSPVFSNNDPSGQRYVGIIHDYLDKGVPTLLRAESGNGKYTWVADGSRVMQRVRYNYMYYYDENHRKVYVDELLSSSFQFDFQLHFNIGYSPSFLEVYTNEVLFDMNFPVSMDFNEKLWLITNILPDGYTPGA